jgi:hypothetical protein
MNHLDHPLFCASCRYWCRCFRHQGSLYECLNIPFSFIPEDQGEEVDLADQFPSCHTLHNHHCEILKSYNSHHVLVIFLDWCMPSLFCPYFILTLCVSKLWYAEIIKTFFFVIQLESIYYVRTLGWPPSLAIYVWIFLECFSCQGGGPTTISFHCHLPSNGSISSNTIADVLLPFPEVSVVSNVVSVPE